MFTLSSPRTKDWQKSRTFSTVMSPSGSNHFMSVLPSQMPTRGRSLDLRPKQPSERKLDLSAPLIRTNKNWKNRVMVRMTGGWSEQECFTLSMRLLHNSPHLACKLWGQCSQFILQLTVVFTASVSKDYQVCLHLRVEQTHCCLKTGVEQCKNC